VHGISRGGRRDAPSVEGAPAGLQSTSLSDIAGPIERGTKRDGLGREPEVPIRDSYVFMRKHVVNIFIP
jgi:hypothetical protein